MNASRPSEHPQVRGVDSHFSVLSLQRMKLRQHNKKVSDRPIKC